MEAKKAYLKQYYLDNREKLLARAKDYPKKNRDRYNAARRKLDRKKRAENPKYKLCHNVRKQLWQQLKDKKNKQKSFDLLGYTAGQLMQHLEQQFVDGMTWNNYGQWHIDHIKPVCAFTFNFPTDSEFRMCWALQNLRPLWAKDNLSKSKQDRQQIAKYGG